MPLYLNAALATPYLSTPAYSNIDSSHRIKIPLCRDEGARALRLHSFWYHAPCARTWSFTTPSATPILILPPSIFIQREKNLPIVALAILPAIPEEYMALPARFDACPNLSHLEKAKRYQ
ncbi:hypothetical protein EYC80_005864 [Monilinia laxa]|uniref:Uncharacterized protein n=1 Tax=Monilinia laxa TaxID=61186 RepID=A0A5N6KFA4_MONLA|nr:hypothetical protein EYC80_005864 [Monilinia laxa]